MVGPATLDFLADFFGRSCASVEGVLLIIQLAHLKHFDEPLTTFVLDEQLDTSSAELASKKLSDPKTAPFLASLFSWSFGPQELASNEDGWPVHDITGLLTSIAEARTDFRFRLCRLKLAFGMMRKVHDVMLHLGYRGIGIEMTPLEMMTASLKGGLLREEKYLGTMTRSVTFHILCFSTYVGGRAGAQETVRRKALGPAAGITVLPRRAPGSPR
jgi:origin recognition complex subunit 3